MTKGEAANEALKLLNRAVQYVHIVDGPDGYVLADTLNELIEGLEWIDGECE